MTTLYGFVAALSVTVSLAPGLWSFCASYPASQLVTLVTFGGIASYVVEPTVYA
ncbi:MAG: hypothetical protein U0414_14145 [Polyangiaceae bacterium]